MKFICVLDGLSMV